MFHLQIKKINLFFFFFFLKKKLLSRWLRPPQNEVSVMVVWFPCGCHLILKTSVNRMQNASSFF